MELEGIDKVRQFREMLAQMPQEQIPLHHLIHGKMYARTIFAKAGTVIVGTEANLDNICVVCGDITVTTENGPIRLTGFNILPATRGHKRVGITHSDTYWTTLVHTDKQTVQEAEDEMTNESHLLLSRKQITGDTECPSLQLP